MLNNLYLPRPLHRFFCNISATGEITEMTKYRENFSRKMAMAGVKPHHRIALGVSGGPDSIGLCVLASGWKVDALVGIDETSGHIDGILGIIVDHGLRSESREEALRVCDTVSQMGIRCEIASCNWLKGRPKQGHLQEAAREMRYQIFRDVCIQHHIGVLLIAHHADDQAELFILRLSRNSGVLGLAGMAFTSQLFPAHMPFFEGDSINHGILLVRPLLEFSKEDMYKICLGGGQEWVEDPTNKSPVFARNRIRMSLRSLSSSIFNSELQAIISACRKRRSFTDQFCNNLVNQAVTIMAYGYAIVDLIKLDPSNVEDLCLLKFVALILQFISQRHRPVRGSVSELLLNYIRNFPCKTSLTAAGCYLCAAPGSRGTKILVCCSVDSPQPSSMELYHTYPCERPKHYPTREIEQIIRDAKSYADHMVPDPSNVPFLHVTSIECIFSEAKKLRLVSDSTHRSILLLQRDEFKHFNAKTEVKPQHELKSESRFPNTLSEPLLSGQSCYFMNRFLVTWRLCDKIGEDAISGEVSDFVHDLDEGSRNYLCRSCVVGRDTVALIRHMVDADWLYLANLSKGQTSENCQTISPVKSNQKVPLMNPCSDYVRLSAHRALRTLKSIPVSARRGLPVLVDPQGLLLSIPSICFKHCPCLSVLTVFKPRVPLGGGYTSFI